MRLSPKKWLEIAGGLISLAGVVFVGMRLHAYVHQLEADFSRLQANAWLFIALLALIYGAGNVFLARAWRSLLNLLGVTVSWGWAFRTYGVSQLAKYVPGNIFHLAGRQAMGMAAGLPTGSLVKSAVWELALIAAVGALFGMLLLPLAFSEVSVWASSILFCMVLAALTVAARQMIAPSAAGALLWQAAFLALSGMVFVGLVATVSPHTAGSHAFSILCGAYVLAWLAGLITPGAPAGVGVREFVLLFLLSGEITEADLLVCVVLGRLVTVVGDLFFFIYATFLRKTGFAGSVR